MNFTEVYLYRQAPEEGWKIQWPKCCHNKDKDGDNNLHVNNIRNDDKSKDNIRNRNITSKKKKFDLIII